MTHKVLLGLELQLGDEFENLRSDVDVVRAMQVDVVEPDSLGADADVLTLVSVGLGVRVEFVPQGDVDFVLLVLKGLQLVEVLAVRFCKGLGLLVSGLQLSDASEELDDVVLEQPVGLVGLDLVVAVLLRAFDLLERAVRVVPRAEFLIATIPLGLAGLIGDVVMGSVLGADAELGLLRPAVTDLWLNVEDGAQLGREAGDDAPVVQTFDV